VLSPSGRARGGEWVVLRVVGLRVEVGGGEVVKEFSLEVGEGEVHLLLGPNGAGKTTLLSAIAGLPRVRVTGGRVLLGGVDVTGLSATERARMGIALAYQIPPELTGVSLEKLAALVAERFGTSRHLGELAELLELKHLMGRDAFRGFSGGERKRAEVFLTALLRPKVALLDEPDSGVDVDSVSLIAEALRFMAAEFNSALLVVTHTRMLAEQLRSTAAHVLIDGRVSCSGPPDEILSRIARGGFSEACAGSF